MGIATGGMGRLLAGLLVAAIATFGLAACGNDSDGDMPRADSPAPPAATQSATSEDANSKQTYNGAYDAKFRDWADDHDDAIVTLTGTVKTLVDHNAFTLAGENGAEDFLVVSKDVSKGLAAGSDVSITGVVHQAFDLPGVEDEIDVDFDDDTVFEDFDRDPYVVASNIATE